MIFLEGFFWTALDFYRFTCQEGLGTQTLAFSLQPMKCSMAPWLIKPSGHAATFEWVQVILIDLVTTVVVVRSFFSSNVLFFGQICCWGVCVCVIIRTCHSVWYHTIPDHKLHCIALHYITLLHYNVEYIKLQIHEPIHTSIDTSIHPCRSVGTYVRMYVGMCMRTHIHLDIM